MADEVFALSPISARAVQPSEADYAAIADAFMETSRGRWFLGEYTRRNRNADTRMVLDAVARLEEAIAAQKQAVPVPDPGPALVDVIGAIRDAVAAARASAAEGLDGLDLEQKLVPVRKGARVIREIAWRLREIGNDGRICDLIDSQVAMIEGGAANISSDQAKAAMTAAFAAIAARLADYGDAEEASQPLAEAGAAGRAAGAEAAEAVRPAAPAARAEPVEAMPPQAEAGPIEPVSFSATAPAEAADVTDQADAHDEAVLDMIALEMGAPQPFDDDEPAMPGEEIHIVEAVEVRPAIVARAPQPAVAPPSPPVVEMPAAVQAAPAPESEISLGSTLIASGIVPKPRNTANDPLAPIRRMSQAEKIAFFS